MAMIFDPSEEYRTELYDRETISRLLRHLNRVLETAARTPDLPLSQFDLAPDGTARPAPPAPRRSGWREFGPDEIEGTIGGRFDEQASRFERRTAVRTPRYEWTYRELRRRAHGVAASLRRLGVSPGDRVALLCAHDAPMLAGLLGASIAGAAYVPLDPSHPHERHLQILSDAAPACIVTDLANAPRAHAFGLPAARADEIATSTSPAPPATDPDALAYILYTSGSTGIPKGVVQTHRNVLQHCRTYTNALRLGPRDRVALCATYGFDAAVMDIFGALLNGATLCPIDVRTEGPESILGWIDVQGVSILHATPTLYRHLLTAAPERTLESVRAVVLGGEEVRRGDVELFRRHFGPRCILVNGLGPTECTVALQEVMTGDAVIPRHTVPVGRPVPGIDVLLLTEEGRVIQGCGTGEIALRGRHVARGYWNRPDLTAAAFSADPADPSVLTYRTGDVGRRLPDGRIEFVGRRDLQLKIRGLRIEPGEIEARLAEHGGIAAAVVDAVETPAGDKRLVAYYVPSGSAPLRPGDIAEYLRARLPDAMVPWLYVPVTDVPLTPNGKADRRALAARIPAAVTEETEERILPSTRTERELAAIWAALLRLPAVAASDNFFELGGHSLLATQLASRVRTAFRVDLPLRQYFTIQTLGALAAAIDESARANGSTQLPAIPRAPRDRYRVRVSYAGELILPPALRAGFVDPDGGTASPRLPPHPAGPIAAPAAPAVPCVAPPIADQGSPLSDVMAN
jgi:amino acid adenylation domain-containing protein